MAPNQKIILFDLASKGDSNKCWSLNPWKTRFALNFKGLDYETVWLNYPELKTRLEPHLPNASAYTSPTIVYTDGSYVADSRVIATLLEKDHPSPSLHLDDPALKKLEDLMPDIMAAVRGHYILSVPKRLLKEPSLDYWYRTREEKVGMSLDELEKAEGGEAGFAKAAPLLQKVTGWLKEKDDGPFFIGKTVSYADFVWAGFLIFFRRIGDDKFSEVLTSTGDPAVHEALLAAVEPWSKRDDH
ncbi:hypothetical protein M406DRAFT_356872 [Cryphonectria parasitica EP155]|uniref:GST N-terminal domain-containing protein n=1 Tax=Cryphonectria parasitica (strain ATCC 38755 / EP155) TaxID=660469 RepID=A0A9P4Y2L1_CRYP1|nr:uncharacterized protein M406DRAFT_356872 [Cryphonectria parasitica EP155]KAF3765207.1 hypothetical protein M406DRAFT_356872 [Cryphonectria parasitica EP155]